jgi:hypothetical protein
MRRRLVLVLSVVSLASPALADIGPKPTTLGRSPGPSGPDVSGIAVAMAEETVDLTLRRDGDAEKLDVRAVFRMRNDGETATFETGFPIGAYRNFESFSIRNGEASLDFDLVDRAAAPPAGDRDGRTRFGRSEDYWYVWQAEYPGKSVSTHEVRYTVDLRSPALNRTGSAGYVLHSGAGWKGPIGKAVVTLRAGAGFTLDHLQHVQPTDGGTRHADRIVWTFSEFEPTGAHDILVGWSEVSLTERLEKAREEAKTSWAGRARVAGTLDLAHKTRLRERTPEELREYLDAIAALVSERGTDGDRVTLPASRGEDRRGYASDPDTLFRWMDVLSDLVERHPASEAARALLRVYVDLCEAFLSGRLLVGGEPLEFAWRGSLDTPERRAARDASVAKRRATTEGWLGRARRVLSAK